MPLVRFWVSRLVMHLVSRNHHAAVYSNPGSTIQEQGNTSGSRSNFGHHNSGPASIARHSPNELVYLPFGRSNNAVLVSDMSKIAMR